MRAEVMAFGDNSFQGILMLGFMEEVPVTKNEALS